MRRLLSLRSTFVRWLWVMLWWWGWGEAGRLPVWASTCACADRRVPRRDNISHVTDAIAWMFGERSVRRVNRLPPTNSACVVVVVVVVNSGAFSRLAGRRGGTRSTRQKSGGVSALSGTTSTRRWSRREAQRSWGPRSRDRRVSSATRLVAKWCSFQVGIKCVGGGWSGASCKFRVMHGLVPRFSMLLRDCGTGENMDRFSLCVRPSPGLFVSVWGNGQLATLHQTAMVRAV